MKVQVIEIKEKPLIEAPAGYRLMKPGEITGNGDLQYVNGVWFDARKNYKITRQSAVTYARKS